MQNLNRVLELIYKKSPFQKKKIEKHLAKRDEQFFLDAEKFIVDYTGYLESQGISIDELVDAYLKLCSDMMKSQIEFMKTGEYPVQSSSEVFSNFYNVDNQIKSHLIGLAISQLLWKTHYDTFQFFGNYIADNHQTIKSYLEIGPGHGLFLMRAMDSIGKDAGITVVDISPAAIEITKSIIDYFRPLNDNVAYHTADMLELDLSKKFDFITMGEVIEHVDFPEKLLTKLKNLISAKGRAFVSTCANCPSVDHVYHYKTVEEIRRMIFNCGLHIEDELVLPVEDMSLDEAVEKKITVNFCTILKN